MDDKEFEELKNQYARTVRENLKKGLLPAAEVVGLTIGDLEQDAWIKIWEKRHKLDLDGNVPGWLCTVAFRAAREAIAKMGMPVDRCNNWKKIVKASEDLYLKLGRKPTDEETAAETGLKVAYIKDTLTEASVINATPFERADKENGMPIPAEKSLSEVYEELFCDEEKQLARAARALCPETNQLILKLYCEKATNQEIGIQIGRSEDQVRQTDLPKALEEFKKHYNDLINGRV
jgi:RNA polymerase sigma factor (sigma-70 family)